MADKLAQQQPKDIQLQPEEKAWTWRNLDGTLVRLGVSAVKTFFCPKATTVEALAFIAFCRSKRLDPFSNEVYLVKYDDRSPARIVVSRDTLIRRAQLAEGGYLGFKSGVIVERKDPDLEQRFHELERTIMLSDDIPDDTKKKLLEKVIELGNYVTSTYTQLIELEGAFVPSGYKLVGGWCTIYSREKEPVTAKVMLSEYNKNQASWKEMPATMIVKVAEAHAHRKYAPSFNSALYTAEEMTAVGAAPAEIHQPAQLPQPAAVELTDAVDLEKNEE